MFRRLLIASLVLTAPLAIALPAERVDVARLAEIRPRMQEFVDRGEVSGAVTLVGRRDGVLSLEAVGSRDLERGLAMEKDTVFRIASMTKPVTAIGILILADEGKLAVDDTVEKHLPEFKGALVVSSRDADTVTLKRPSRPVTLRDLLTHTSGVPGAPPQGLASLYTTRDRTLAEGVLAVSQRPLEFEPGSKWSYSNMGIDALGRVIEVVSGKSYEEFFRRRVFEPLGMRDTTFWPREEDRPRIAQLYDHKDAKLVPVASFLGEATPGKYPLPAGGLYSTAADLARLYRMMLGRGALDGKRVLSERSVEVMTQLQTGDLRCGFVDGMGFGFGWAVVKSPQGVTEMLSAGSYGHGGAFGTQGWIDPKRDVFVVLLIQRAGLPNADASEMRRVLQSSAISALVD
jgi:CubicO group peptidase (beta-lactamase class C family)